MVKLNFGKYLTTILFFCCLISCLGQGISVQKAEEFVPKSAILSETRMYVGDLNRDGIKDALLRFKVLNEPSENEHFYLLLAKKDGTLNIVDKDIFSFNNKNGIVFDKITISKDCNFTVEYIGTESNYGSYRKITFNYHSEYGSHYWILKRDEELFVHKVFAPAPQKPIIVTESEMQNIGGEYFGNIKENLYDVILRKKIKKYLPDTTSECRAYSGDLNRDNFEDIILRFKISTEPETKEHFYLFTGQDDGTYKLVVQNDNIELDNVDGHIFDKVVIKNGYFSLEYTGYGNTSGTYEIVTFKYSEVAKNWLLHRVGSKFVHRYGDGNSKEEITTPKDFGKILFKDY
ncbi:hypothetical protein SAMN05443549_1154 [Flavobacterium fluvii]|uniref:Uncharacterized protein n=2 Tax=Flavobacterium fluvii TaxID=468056 RepID=A0A1M5PYR0_9FLAO|nr:hypothetical protein SAMN05443549_1154 [Flavobacterium fluvii]